MADPLSITASTLTVITAAVQSTKSLHDAVRRFKDRDKTLRRLENELEDLSKILSSLATATTDEDPILALLQGPVKRCSQVCHEFERALQVFSRKSTTGFRDWAKMEFMKGGLNDFIDTLAGYKSTISVGILTVNLHNSKVSQQTIQEFDEMIQDTVHSLKLLIQRIDEKLTRLPTEGMESLGVSIELGDEKEVTRQCLRVCESAKAQLQDLGDRASTLLPQVSGEQDLFEAQLRTREVMDEAQASFARTVQLLSKRLEAVIRGSPDGDDADRLRLQSDVEVSKQCLDICSVASEMSRQKVYRIGEIVADGDSDQVAVNTLADLFDIKIARSSGNSAQLFGAMSDESLQLLAEKRYNSRFGAAKGDTNAVSTGSGSSTYAQEGAKKDSNDKPRRGTAHPDHSLRSEQTKPGPNEMRKRFANDAQ